VRDVMRRRLATFAISLGLALGAPALGVVAGTGPPACAATDQRAALVVDTGSRARSYCVALGADAVSGTELIRLAHDQYGLDYRLGFGGRAVCRLAGVGVDAGDCFGAYPDFWGYWHGDDDGGWIWASGSAADWTVEAGDAEGWQWGPGQDGDTHAAPPATREEEVCEPAEPPPPPSPGGGGGGDGGGGDGSGPAGAASSPSGSTGPSPSDDDRETRDRVRSEETPTVSPTGSPTPSSTGAPSVELAAGSGTGDDRGGGSRAAGTVIALVAVVVLGAAGAVVLRRRRAA
jgi:hypothetical protein